jgi:hypothetical protein
VVHKAGTTARVSASSTSSGPVTFTATVSPVAGTSGTPTGTVSFYLDGVLEGTASLIAAQAVLTFNVGTGSHTVMVVYGGDGNFAGSSASVTQTYQVHRGT